MIMNVCDVHAISGARGGISDQNFEELDKEDLVHLLHGGVSHEVAEDDMTQCRKTQSSSASVSSYMGLGLQRARRIEGQS